MKKKLILKAKIADYIPIQLYKEAHTNYYSLR